MATADYFLKLDGIDGESQDSKFKGQIDVLSYSFGATNSGTSHVGGGGGMGRVSFADMIITKNLDKASPALFLHCCNGQPIAKAVLTARKAGGDQQPYCVITMNDVLVSSHATGSPTATRPAPRLAGATYNATIGDWMATETFTLNFATISYAFSEQAADGSVKGAITKGWNVKLNKIL